VLIVAIAWMYVVLMMAAAEAVAPNGSVLGAVFTLVLYGVIPLSIVMYLMATPARRRARRAREAEQGPPAAHLPPAGAVSPIEPAEPVGGDASAAPPDGGSHSAGDAVAAKREEP
jgi:hypothetical protein